MYVIATLLLETKSANVIICCESKLHIVYSVACSSICLPKGYVIADYLCQVSGIRAISMQQ